MSLLENVICANLAHHLSWACIRRLQMCTHAHTCWKDIVPPTEYTFECATGVCFDALGRLAVADAEKGTITCFHVDGTVRSTIRGLREPQGLTLDNEDNLLVVDNDRVHAFRHNGEQAYTFCMAVSDTPTTLAVNAKGDILVPTANMVQAFKKDGSLLGAFGAQTDSHVWGVACMGSIVTTHDGIITIFTRQYIVHYQTYSKCKAVACHGPRIAVAGQHGVSIYSKALRLIDFIETPAPAIHLAFDRISGRLAVSLETVVLIISL